MWSEVGCGPYCEKRANIPIRERWAKGKSETTCSTFPTPLLNMYVNRAMRVADPKSFFSCWARSVYVLNALHYEYTARVKESVRTPELVLG